MGPVDDDHMPFLQQGKYEKFSLNQLSLNILLLLIPKTAEYFLVPCSFWLIAGVPVLNIIATPFPSYRHTVEDSADKVHSDTVENLIKVLVVFLAEYLGL